MTFERENRYVVLKHKDIVYLSEAHKQQLKDILHRIDVIRAERGAPLIKCVVIEQDWPEYEYVWGLIQHRMEKS